MKQGHIQQRITDQKLDHNEDQTVGFILKLRTTRACISLGHLLSRNERKIQQT